jgi:superfamily II DNA helicase RecQ
MGFVRGGVTLTIVPLLSLGADQTTKLQTLRDAKDLPIQLYHLDEYRDRATNRSLCRLIDGLHDDSVTLFLFSSPQKLLSKEWSDCIGSLIKRRSVPLTLCIDECHLYAQFGAEFRSEFGSLKPCIFDPIVNYRSTMPILFLTATASKTVITDLEGLTGLHFDKTNLLWSPAPSSVSRRQVYLDIQPRESPLAPFKADIRHRYSKPPSSDVTVSAGVSNVIREKLIFYLNSRKRLLRYTELVSVFLDEEAYSFDVVIVHGSLFREQKFHNIQTFCIKEDLFVVDPTTGKPLYFVPQILNFHCWCCWGWTR